ncbi:DUF2267 domain-containing protein [Hyalangium versicolor]|uniref:DUF2267 domain-containing protein n=1 Tax=Hyalangium versicolor TaxID=2861190 RepID=UPI001CCB1900|nr:DUF2267 domain-containing protein [Hyalangium versicolor]
MTHDEFLSHVAERAGLPGLREAERTLHAVLGTISERLSWRAAQSLADDLPASLASSLRSGGAHQDFDLKELYARVARRDEVRLGFAVERTAVVCQVIAEALSPAALRQLREALPEPMGELFTPREPEAHFEPVHRAPRGRTLAEGRPGSQHPLSEARPERAHSHSVAQEDNPHGDTKLSSATGLTQEREQETLATAHPRSVLEGAGE